MNEIQLSGNAAHRTGWYVEDSAIGEPGS
jgi:hypothetical protein